jgi:membrane protease YdiL (CAAX protease family)
MLPLAETHFHMSKSAVQGLADLWMWLLGAAIVFYIVAVERLPLSSVGLRKPTWMSLGLGIAATVVGFIFVGGFIVGYLLPLLHLSNQTSTAQKIFALPYWQRFLIVVRAGIVEELLMRGYGIERLMELGANRFVAGGVTLAAFTAAHLSYGSVGQLFVAAAAGLVLTVLYIWRRDLSANMISHFLTDAIGVLLVR